MSLSSLQLDAFLNVARTGSFSIAANILAVTQSALSQRILNLEQELGSALFVREPSGIRLTELGQNLLRYCQTKESLEMEFLSNAKPNKTKGYSGIARIAGFSTITQSVLVPILGSLIKENPGIHLELMTAEIKDLSNKLITGQTDFIFLYNPLEKQGIENHKIGYEENVLVRPIGKKYRKDVFLDHDADDSMTFDFFKQQGKTSTKLVRNYLGEMYSILEGVKQGLGQAVVPMHLIKQTKGIEVVPGYKPFRVPVYCCYYSQAYYTDLQKALIECLIKEPAKYLA
ncbi:MAG: LysR family transcriptional regulator [Bdellovibrio sp.]